MGTRLFRRGWDERFHQRDQRGDLVSRDTEDHSRAASISSGRIDDLPVAQDVVPTKRVPDRRLLPEVNIPFEDALQVFDHINPIECIPRGVFIESGH